MAKKTLEKRDGDDNQPFLFADLPEVRLDGSENLDQIRYSQWNWG